MYSFPAEIEEFLNGCQSLKEEKTAEETKRVLIECRQLQDRNVETCDAACENEAFVSQRGFSDIVSLRRVGL